MAKKKPASMRLQSVDRERAKFSARTREPYRRFNEAAIRGSRKVEIPELAKKLYAASMRPQFGDRGRTSLEYWTVLFPPLQ